MKEQFDLFKAVIPPFHLAGHRKIGSPVGFCLSVLLVTLVIVFTGIRGRYLVMGDRPNISSFTVQDERNATEMVNLTQHNFNVAFAVQKIEGDDFEPIGDPDYVQWLAYFYTETKHEKNYTLVNVHKCTEEDFEYFHEVTEYQKYIVEEMKKKDMFFCLDKDD